MQFSNTLIYWYLQNKRELPWRKTKNPYYIWLSEIILQQTRVNQGLAYYEHFITSFPTVYDLANAEEETVLKHWQGLGYYSRARNLHHAANYIVTKLKGIFPSNYKGLLLLKGVGHYTASAIASICYNEPTAAVDGNVYRVLARYFGIHTPINSTEGNNQFKQLAQQLIDHKQPGIYNQAIMEFGALQCKPQNPNCINCPLRTTCKALQQQLIGELPVKEKKGIVKKRFFNYLVIIDSHHNVQIQQRREKGIWRNLYEFPLIETSNEIHLKKLLASPKFKSFTHNMNVTVTLYNTSAIVHKLSHQHLFTKFWIVTADSQIENSISWNDFEKYPVPTLIHNFVENFKTNA